MLIDDSPERARCFNVVHSLSIKNSSIAISTNWENERNL